MKKFKIPRKLKKRLKKGFWLYNPDENGSSLMASPHRNKKDFIAYKKGMLRNLIDPYNSKKRQMEFNKKIDKKVMVSDEVLKSYVDDIMRKDLRRSSYEILIKAKNSKKAISDYYNFVNAYQLVEKGESSFGNICCLAIENAEKRLKG